MGKASRRKKERSVAEKPLRTRTVGTHTIQTVQRAEKPLQFVLGYDNALFKQFISERLELADAGLWGSESWPLNDWVPPTLALDCISRAVGFSGWEEASHHAVSSPSVAERNHIHSMNLLSYHFRVAGAWEEGKRVYEFDSAFWEELVNTSTGDGVLTESLRFLPDWCPYIAFPEPINKVYGAWVRSSTWHNEHEGDLNLTEPGLAIAWDCEIASDPPIIYDKVFLGRNRTVDEAIKVSVERLNKNNKDRPEGWPADWTPPLRELFAALMYLSSEKPDVSGQHAEWSSSCPRMNDLDDTDVVPSVAEYQEQERERRRNKPSRVVPWKVGVRVGKALRACEQKEKRDRQNVGVGGRVVRPHIRRAHWHTYWCGPMNGTRYQRVKWMPPIPVAVHNTDDLPVVVTPVAS